MPFCAGSLVIRVVMGGERRHESYVMKRLTVNTESPLLRKTLCSQVEDRDPFSLRHSVIQPAEQKADDITHVPRSVDYADDLYVLSVGVVQLLYVCNQPPVAFIRQQSVQLIEALILKKDFVRGRQILKGHIFGKRFSSTEEEEINYVYREVK